MSQLLVQEYKYNGAKHYSYPVHLLSQTADLLIVHGALRRPLNHPGRKLWNWPVPNQTIEYHFMDRPYNVMAGWHPDGSFQRYYCNIATPAKLEGGIISSVDLDLDLTIDAGFRYTVEDEDEFEQHRVAWSYPPEVVAMAREGLAELIRLVESRAFPFDGSAEQFLRARPGFRHR